MVKQLVSAITTMNKKRRAASLSLKKVVEKVVDNYKTIVKNMIQNFGKMGCNMSLKLHSTSTYFAPSETKIVCILMVRGGDIRPSIKAK